jgi:aryl-alcohol dehydrogenase-like predicted oxidoreductase
MRYRLLGHAGLRVSELSLGTMTFGADWGWGADRDESKKQFDAYAALGGNFIDTANRYTEGTSERLIGDFIAADRDHWVVATKYTLFDRKGDPNFSGNHRKNLMRSVKASLERLRTDHLDLLWVHMWDFTTHPDEIMRALDDLVRQGTVHYIGISDTPAWIVSQCNTLAQLRGWTPFAALQLRYSLIDRTAERDLLPMARAFDLAVTPWSVLGAGVLTGKYNANPDAQGRAAKGAARQTRNLAIAAVVQQEAARLGATPSQVAIAWAMAQPGVILPILGARNAAQLEDTLGALDVTLDAQALAALDDASRIEPGFPHDFLHQDAIRDVASGETWRMLDRHRG